MEPVYDFARLAHVAAGSLALVTFWTAAVMRKGTAVHRAVGNIYMAAMLGIVLTALPLAAKAFIAGKPVTGTFLAYLVIITFTGAFLARRAVRSRRSFEQYASGAYRPLAWANLAAGLFVLALGIQRAAPLLIGMSVIGVVIGPSMLRLAARGPVDRGWWLERHYTGILGAGVATHIAFLNLGLQRLVPGDFSPTAQYAAWFGPLLVALVAGRWLDRRYGRAEAGAGDRHPTFNAVRAPRRVPPSPPG